MGRVPAGGPASPLRHPWAGVRSARGIVTRAAVLLALAGSTAATGMGPEVTVESHAGAFDVRGSFKTHAPLSVAWDVLTDYGHIASFVSSMHESRIEQRNDDTLRVHQVASISVLLFHRNATVTLAVIETPPHRIEFVDVLGQDFRSYAGSWSLQPDSGATKVSYVLEAAPRTGPSGWLSRGVMSRTTSDLLAQVRREIERRAAQR